MRRSIITMIATGLIACSCTLSNGYSSGHTAHNLEEYTRTMFINNVVFPAGAVNMLVMLDQYISATEEERQSDAFQWHRENIFHEDDVTYMVRGFGTVHTYGTSFLDPQSDWTLDTGIEVIRIGDNCWKLKQNYIYDYNYNSTVTFVGQNEGGKNVFTVEAYNTHEARTSAYSDATVKATITTPEGSMTLTDPRPLHNYHNNRTDIPEGYGVFRLDTERHGKPLDWAELRFDQSGKTLIFRSNL